MTGDPASGRLAVRLDDITSNLISSSGGATVLLPKQCHGFLLSPPAQGKVQLGAHRAAIARLRRRCGSRRARARSELDGVMPEVHRLTIPVRSRGLRDADIWRMAESIWQRARGSQRSRAPWMRSKSSPSQLLHSQLFVRNDSGRSGPAHPEGSNET